MTLFVMSNNITDLPKETCSGCTACNHICPVKAIKMLPDTQGFLYPNVDENTCISCGLCLKVCPYPKELHRKPLVFFAFKRKDKDSILLSSSGAFAASMTEYYITHGGTAYGVIETDNFEIKTVRATTLEEISEFRGSKYVQSDLEQTFVKVLEDLIKGLPVVYFASSCHIDGLLRFLDKNKVRTNDLLTVDFICHGVPSPAVFKAYANYGKKHFHMIKYLFRTKNHGWGKGSKSFAPTLVVRTNGKVKEKTDTSFAQAWLDLFFANNCLRPHCYSCPYAGNGRSADITMADFWGIEKYHSDFFDSDGVSLVICNTEKGIKHIRSLGEIDLLQSSFEEAAKKQRNMFGPSKKGSRYNEFWTDYTKKDFAYILKKYTRYNTKSILKRTIKNILGIK